ncbi:MAG TPA: alkaline phosphatase PhoX [Cytophagaceae bacterium]|jgi:secreted PhoX family phosphatase|nr:alkaline phosphatase PhoX [Cytophagaceae bacterium]
MKNFALAFFFYLVLAHSLCAQVNIFPLSQVPFKEAPYSNTHKGIVLSEEFEYYILFQQGDTVFTKDGKASPAKSNHDYIAFIPGKSAKHASLFVSHECNDSSNTLGDGGGGTIFSIEKKDYQWKRTGKFNAVDFKPVGGTYDNCGGLYIPKTKRILSAEEYPPESNIKLYKKGKGTRDTTSINGLKRNENIGWMVEIDPSSHVATKKLYTLGRFSHESAWLSKDGKSLYMSDDNAPGVFFKFVADNPYSFDKGTLFAYNQRNNSNHWIALPNNLDSLVIIRDIALRKGATAFARLEWITATEDKLFLTETGSSPLSLKKQDLPKEQFAQHLQAFIHNDTLQYPNGSLLAFDFKTEQVTVRLAGGRATTDTTKYFSNPDALTCFNSNGKTWLIICEDQIEGTPISNEIWWLDASIQKPTVDSLYRFLIAAPGSEPTGVCLSKDRKTLFLNIQHPAEDNPLPFNRSSTLAIRSRSWKATYRNGQGVSVSFW